MMEEVSVPSQVFAFTHWVFSVTRPLTELRRPFTELSGPLTIVRRPLTETKKWLEEFVKGIITLTFHIVHRNRSHCLIKTLHRKPLSCNVLRCWWRVFQFANHDKKEREDEPIGQLLYYCHFFALCASFYLYRLIISDFFPKFAPDSGL